MDNNQSIIGKSTFLQHTSKLFNTVESCPFALQKQYFKIYGRMNKVKGTTNVLLIVLIFLIDWGRD